MDTITPSYQINQPTTPGRFHTGKHIQIHKIQQNHLFQTRTRTRTRTKTRMRIKNSFNHLIRMLMRIMRMRMGLALMLINLVHFFKVSYIGIFRICRSSVCSNRNRKKICESVGSRVPKYWRQSQLYFHVSALYS